jgi:MoaA/NifB/PqqE/SkfB family radical SAM enzyme
MATHIPHLEMHVTHACNLACESCSHYSNHRHKGHVGLAEADGWMSAWSRRVTVGLFSLLGGEPTIHPELAKFVPLARRHWPRARIEIVTNGFFLDRHEDLPAAMAGSGDVVLAAKSWYAQNLFVV